MAPLRVGIDGGLKTRILQRKFWFYEIRFSHGKSMSPGDTDPERGLNRN